MTQVGKLQVDFMTATSPNQSGSEIANGYIGNALWQVRRNIEETEERIRRHEQDIARLREWLAVNNEAVARLEEIAESVGVPTSPEELQS